MATLEQLRALAARRVPRANVRPPQGPPTLDDEAYGLVEDELNVKAGRSIEKNTRAIKDAERARTERALGVLKGNVRGAGAPQFTDPDEALAEELVPDSDSLFAHDLQQNDIDRQQGQTYMHVSSRDDLRGNAVDQLRQKLGLDRREHEQRIEEKRLQEEGLNARARLQAEGASKPYYTPVQTGQGIQSFDHRTGQVVGRVGDTKPGETAQTAIAAGENVVHIGGQLKTMVRPEWIGPLAGRVSSMANAFIGDDAGRAKFEAFVANYRNAMIKAITGAQMSEPEASRIMQQLPDMNLPPTTFLAKLEASQFALQDALERRKSLAYGTRPAEGVAPSVAPAPAGPVKDVNYYLGKYGKR